MLNAACVYPAPKTITHTPRTNACVFGPYSLTFLWGCEARSQTIIITVVVIKTLRTANRATGTDSDNVSSGWGETREHTWRRRGEGVKERAQTKEQTNANLLKKKKKRLNFG